MEFRNLQKGSEMTFKEIHNNILKCSRINRNRKDIYLQLIPLLIEEQIKSI